ncbi:MAG: hypothetical protein L6R42_000041 [Xanthoria sp. 1 TBL-2021]|nr:MAG: hypothetical protein L6R42_000041 [Xanthoria sp. 1 TBL-2021]
MASLSQTSKEAPTSLNKGEYQPAAATDLRSPCPIVNAFANYGLIPRNGRNVRAEELDTAIKEIGLSLIIRKTFVWGAFFECYDKRLSGLKEFIRSPLAYLYWHFGIRNINQQDSDKTACLDLDQLSRHGAIEYDVSMTRRDFAQGGDNHSKQEDLVDQLLQSSSSYLTSSDFAKLRRKRLEQQKKDNPELCFPSVLHWVTAGQIAAIQTVFGHADKEYRIPVSYAEALFRDERLPVKEGWQKSQGWLAGVVGVVVQLVKVRIGIGRVSS